MKAELLGAGITPPQPPFAAGDLLVHKDFSDFLVLCVEGREDLRFVLPVPNTRGTTEFHGVILSSSERAGHAVGTIIELSRSCFRRVLTGERVVLTP